MREKLLAGEILEEKTNHSEYFRIFLQDKKSNEFADIKVCQKHLYYYSF